MANQPKKYKKFVATAATATLVASAIVPVASAASFSDVPADNEFAQYINALTDEGIINGYPSTNTFKPAASLTRGQVVKMLGRWVENNGVELPSDWKTKAYFKDVPTNHKDQELVKYAALVAKSGVFGGAAGNLMAEKNITRQQMAKVLNGAYAAVNGQSLIEIAEGLDNVRIPDLGNASAEYEDAIQALMNLEISSTTSGNFRPLQNVTRAQFSKFLYNTINFEAVNVSPFEIKAVNNTTVEVIFQEDIESIDKVKFEIDGLKITNAVVKQTNKRTAVLTTESQKGGTEYTVKVDGEKAGTFVGIAAVVPSKVELVSTSVQGKLGQEVKVQAKVTVAEGQSKAGIPVTFSIPGNANDTVKPTVTGEAYTDENGVATYTYTRYAATTDDVTVYATGDRSKFAVGYVFWGVDTILSIEEVTTGTTINNGANKTYKVTYKNPTTGKSEANKTFNIGFVENMNVTSDKIANASINGVQAVQLSNGTSLEAAQITTDSKGEATFTVSGTNTAVTPVVYALNTVSGESTKAYKPNALQATAPKVTFAALQAAYTIEITREGGEVAATGVTNGREYKVIVKDKEGNLAKNETVNVAFNEDLDRVISTNTDAQFVVNKAYAGKQISVKTNDKGEATFVVSSNTVNAYVTPIAWIDINTANAKQGSLDEGEPKAVAPISYFQAAYLDGSAIKSYLPSDLTEAVTEFKGTETAVFRAELVNQSGKQMPGTSVKKVTYTIYNTGANDIQVGTQVISPNRSYTVTYDNNTNNDLYVTSVDNKTTSVKVIATGTAINTDGKDYAFTAKEASAKFTSTTSVGTQITERVVAVNKDYLEFEGKELVSLKDAKFFGSNGVELIGVDAFIAELTDVTLYPNGAVVTYLQDAEGKKSFKVVRKAAAGNAVNEQTTLETAKITRPATQAVAATAATATVTSAQLSTQDLTVNGRQFTYNAAAGNNDTLTYNSLTDLVAKINASGGDVTATEVSGDLKLTGKADGTQFTYRIGTLTPVTTTNGIRATGSVQQQVTFTFSTAVNVSSGATVIVNGTTGTVASVEGTKVVVTFTTPISNAVNSFTVDGNALKSKLTDEVVDLNSVNVTL